jgi:hypothetical protein
MGADRECDYDDHLARTGLARHCLEPFYHFFAYF